MECDRLLATRRRGSLRAWHLVAGYGCRLVHTKSNNWRRQKRTFCGTDRQTGRQADRQTLQAQVIVMGIKIRTRRSFIAKLVRNLLDVE